MTSRRAAPGYDQRLSRAFQFRPGHVGGRVASAQPVVRRDGTLPLIVGAGGAPPVDPGTPTEVLIYPDRMPVLYPGEFSINTVVGASVYAACSDTSDANYTQTEMRPYDGIEAHMFWGNGPLFEMEPYSVPAGKIIQSAVLEFRAKLVSSADPSTTSTEVRISKDRDTSYGHEFTITYGDFSHGDPFGLTTTFSDEQTNAYPWFAEDYDDWVSVMGAGLLQVQWVGYGYQVGDLLVFSMMRMRLTLVNG